jgi:hypothetical protein
MRKGRYEVPGPTPPDWKRGPKYRVRSREVRQPPIQLPYQSNTSVRAGKFVSTTLTAPAILEVCPYVKYETVADSTHPGPPYLSGGGFDLKRYTIKRVLAPFSYSYTSGTKNPKPYVLGNVNYNILSSSGVCWHNQPTGTIAAVPTSSYVKSQFDAFNPTLADLNAWGATGIAKFKPLKPKAGITAALVELWRDGLPSLPGQLLRRVKNAQQAFKSPASELLNYEFGIKPLVNDIRELYHLWKSMDDELQQIIRNNGRPIRRKGSLMNSQSTPVVTNLSAPTRVPNYPSIGGSDSPSVAVGRKVVTVYEKMWFSASFRYYIPNVASGEWSRAAKQALFGARPSLSLLYSLIPWTWLGDWFSNIGDVIDNYSDNGIADLVIDYAYVMHSYKEVTEYQHTANGLFIQNILDGEVFKQPKGPSRFSTIEIRERKRRNVATPFGFGLTLSGLTPRQWAILTSLGLSRTNFG